MFLAGIPHERLDIASDEAAKTMFKRKNGGNPELPMILVNGIRPGSIEDLEEAAEYRKLRQFLSLDEPDKKVLDEIETALGGLTEEEASKLAAELDDIDLQKAKTPTVVPTTPTLLCQDTTSEASAVKGIPGKVDDPATRSTEVETADPVEVVKTGAKVVPPTRAGIGKSQQPSTNCLE